MRYFSEADIRKLIGRFISEEILFVTTNALHGSLSLSESGALDSTTLLELLSFIETEFDVVISLDAITSETFDTLDSITGLVMAHLSSHPTADTAGSASSDSP